MGADCVFLRLRKRRKRFEGLASTRTKADIPTLRDGARIRAISKTEFTA